MQVLVGRALKMLTIDKLQEHILWAAAPIVADLERGEFEPGIWIRGHANGATCPGGKARSAGVGLREIISVRPRYLDAADVQGSTTDIGHSY